ncbi:hypothetical protein CJO90_05665 [Ralstonia solanacearum]|nr:hypothetical protein CJO83_05665 [Ralstonia solanacearum]AXW42588.1 hypothetical protein CJO90_05665 [Ralstonia solanacearum]AXW65901.1 hypothetical protein CJO95_05660 [Ralstonia solanacearum]
MSDQPFTDPVLSHNRAVLLDTLRAAGAATVVITYSGQGDEGNPNAIQILDAGGEEIAPGLTVTIQQEEVRYVNGQWQSTCTTVDLNLCDALEAFADRAVDRYHAGYWNGEGREGEITFDVAAGTVCMAHRDHYLESILTETNL